MIPTLNHYSDIPFGSIYGIFILTFYLTISDILSGIYFDILSGIYFDILPGISSDILFGILSGIVSGIHSGILSGICSDILWHSFWHSIWYIFGDSLWLRSGGKHCDPALAVEVPAGTTLILGLLFGSGMGPLRSCACSWGPWGALWSWVCCSGLAGTAAISRLQLRSGGEHSDLGFAVRVWQGPLRSRACSWCPAQEVKQEKEEASWHWHNIQQPSPDRWAKN